jgi:GNAT superfamily N-acetyltransferase
MSRPHSPPLTARLAIAWSHSCLADLRRVNGLVQKCRIVGTVQLLTAIPMNQPHLCEIAKLIVHPRARRLGIGRSLMGRSIERAMKLGKTLVTLDTRTGTLPSRYMPRSASRLSVLSQTSRGTRTTGTAQSDVYVPADIGRCQPVCFSLASAWWAVGWWSPRRGRYPRLSGR